jgi:cytochrome c5
LTTEIPAYYLSYSAEADDIAELRKEIAALRRELAALRGVPLKAANQKPHEKVMTANCMTCHSTTSAKKHGTFTMDGPSGIREFSAAEKDAILKNVVSKSMPPPKTQKPLTPQEWSAVVTGVIESKTAETPPKP